MANHSFISKQQLLVCNLYNADYNIRNGDYPLALPSLLCRSHQPPNTKKACSEPGTLITATFRPSDALKPHSNQTWPVF